MVASVRHMKNRNDAVHKIVTNIMSIEVPPEGQLVNPFKPKRRQGSQVTLEEMTTKKAPAALPDNVSEWTNKHFVTYFARKYQSFIGGNYKITFTSDLPIIKQIGDFFASNGIDKNEFTKKLLDWAFDNSEQIIRKYNYITLLSVEMLSETLQIQVCLKKLIHCRTKLKQLNCLPDLVYQSQ